MPYSEKQFTLITMPANCRPGCLPLIQPVLGGSNFCCFDVTGWQTQLLLLPPLHPHFLFSPSFLVSRIGSEFASLAVREKASANFQPVGLESRLTASIHSTVTEIAREMPFIIHETRHKRERETPEESLWALSLP